MKRLRIPAAALLLTVLCSATAFADVAPMPYASGFDWFVYCIPVIIILVAIALLRSSIKRRREKTQAEQEYIKTEGAQIFGSQPESPQADPVKENDDAEI